jgi:hypothetical protein
MTSSYLQDINAISHMGQDYDDFVMNFCLFGPAVNECEESDVGFFMTQIEIFRYPSETGCNTFISVHNSSRPVIATTALAGKRNGEE